MILIRYEDGEYYIAEPISTIDIGSYVFISGYEKFGEVQGYANTSHNLIKVKGESSYFSVSQNKLYNIIGSTKPRYKLILNKKDLNFQFGLYTPKEIIEFYLQFCDKNKEATIDDFNNLFFDNNRNVFNIHNIETIDLKFGDVRPLLY